MKTQIIAEIKTRSPFGYVSPDTWEELFAIAERAGDMISIHTDPRWSGSFELIKRAKRLTKKPILAKGIHETDELVKKAIDAGADFVLVVGRIPNIYTERCLIEPNTLEELARLPKHLRAVWNSRDLKTGGQKEETFAEARKVFTGWLCQASNISDLNDIHPKADAVLIGTHLKRLFGI